ncbi:MAG: hypothetical protein K2Q01_01865 [Rickettsiales bacterium]|nr:hypothetical protein [Rickettsiales bacterium]
MEILAILDIITGLTSLLDLVIIMIDVMYYLRNHRRKRTKYALKTMAVLYGFFMAAILYVTGKNSGELGALRLAVYPLAFAFFFTVLISAARLEKLRTRIARKQSGRPNI